MTKRILLALLVVDLAWTVSDVRRVWIWHDNSALWADAVRVTPCKSRPWVNLANALEAAGDLKGAMIAHRKWMALVANNGCRLQDFSDY